MTKTTNWYRNDNCVIIHSTPSKLTAV